MSNDEIKELRDNLDNIFSNLQCLPPSKPPNKGGTVIWSAIGGKVQFITNSLFYRITEVCSKTQDKGSRPVCPQTLLRDNWRQEYNMHMV